VVALFAADVMALIAGDHKGRPYGGQGWRTLAVRTGALADRS